MNLANCFLIYSLGEFGKLHFINCAALSDVASRHSQHSCAPNANANNSHHEPGLQGVLGRDSVQRPCPRGRALVRPGPHVRGRVRRREALALQRPREVRLSPSLFLRVQLLREFALIGASRAFITFGGPRSSTLLLNLVQLLLRRGWCERYVTKCLSRLAEFLSSKLRGVPVQDRLCSGILIRSFPPFLALSFRRIPAPNFNEQIIYRHGGTQLTNVRGRGRVRKLLARLDAATEYVSPESPGDRRRERSNRQLHGTRMPPQFFLANGKPNPPDYLTPVFLLAEYADQRTIYLAFVSNVTDISPVSSLHRPINEHAAVCWLPNCTRIRPITYTFTVPSHRFIAAGQVERMVAEYEEYRYQPTCRWSPCKTKADCCGDESLRCIHRKRNDRSLCLPCKGLMRKCKVSEQCCTGFECDPELQQCVTEKS